LVQKAESMSLRPSGGGVFSFPAGLSPHTSDQGGKLDEQEIRHRLDRAVHRVVHRQLYRPWRAAMFQLPAD
jgi:hypothetical protein